MAIIHDTVFLGHDLRLFLPDPNWESELELVHRLKAEVEAGTTGRENRWRRRQSLIHELAATWWLEREATEELQGALWTMGDQYYGVPLTVDKSADAAAWADRIYDAEWVLNYDDTGYEILAKAAIPPNPTYEYLAPLLVGRLDKRPQLRAFNETESTFSLRLLERSPWGFRIAPAAQAVGDDWPESLPANWDERPVDQTDDVLIYDDLGDGRIEAVDGQEGVTRRRQKFGMLLVDRTEIRTLLNFFVARQGRVQSWVVPWLLKPSEASSAATPHSTRVRFASDELVLRYHSPKIATAATIEVVQLPWEIEATAGETPVRTSEAWLYRLTMAVPGGPIVWRYTSWEHDLTRSDGTYMGDSRSLIEHDKLTQTIDLSDDPATITAWIFEGNPLLRVVQRTLDMPLKIEILSCDPDAPEAAELRYTGEIAKVGVEGRRLNASTQVLGGLLDQKVPALYFGPTCGYAFCGPGCGLAVAAWTFGGTIVSQAGQSLVVAVTSNPPGAALGADYFARGWVKKGAADTFEMRQIIRSSAAVAGQLTLTLKRPLRAFVVGQAVTWMPHCTGTRAECENKYNNYINMFAHPHIGSRNLSIPTREINASAGKK